MFEKSKWIWATEKPQPDEYAEFKVEFIPKNNARYVMNICADSNYSVSVCGKTAFFGQYPDYPEHRVYDSVDITEFLNVGETAEVVIYCYYVGKKLGTYKLSDAGVIFDITEDGNIIAVSDENTLSRLSPDYSSHKCSEYNPFIGYRFFYDFSHSDTEYAESVYSKLTTANFYPRPNRMLVAKSPEPFNIVKHGSFEYGTGEHLGQKMHSAKLFDASFLNMTVESNKNVFFVSELERQRAGFLHFDIETDSECDVEIGFGEHLIDGLCRTDKFNYTVVVHCLAGRNVFTEKFKRFGCRYLQFFADTKKIKINYAGIIPTEYPIEFKPFCDGNPLHEKIYDIAAHTLLCDMHEHYEDCCYREQALYVLDSRNEMLFTYAATGDYEFARSCLSLIGRSYDELTGLFALTAPSDAGTLIPSYTPPFFLSVQEYTEHSGDKTLAQEVLPVLTKAYNNFKSRLDARGVIPNFSYDSVEGRRFWDFFDWTPTMHDDPHCADFEAPLNAWFSIMLRSFAYINMALGNKDEAMRLVAEHNELNRNIARVFFNENDLVFKSFENKHKGKYSVYTNALCVLCGAADYVDTSRIMEILRTNAAENFGLSIDSDSLATCAFRYDALLRTDKEKYKQDIIDDIDKTYKPMVDAGDTTFWETSFGAEDMDGTGSLCHAWSAAPLLYYRKLILNEEF